ncbi:MAG: IS3 family transposase [Syntrophobacterales bacterium]|nr:IS3 family transposase [Syntrophobacterales bacterium]
MFRVEEMCRVFEVSRSGYYRWLKRSPSPRELSNRKLDAMICTIYDDTKGRYGSPKITRELRETGHRMGKNRVARCSGRLGAEQFAES